MTDLEKELVEKLAKAWWDARRKFGDGEWPHDSRRQPYCQSTYREVEVLLPTIRSHTQALVAAAFARATNLIAQVRDDYHSNDGPFDMGMRLQMLENEVYSLTPADAARELERVKASSFLAGQAEECGGTPKGIVQASARGKEQRE